MARGLNKVLLIGNLGDDPETRYTQSDTAVTTIRVATTAVWKDKNGDLQERTEWHRCVAFGKQAETIEEYSRKGDQLYIEGRLHYDKYDDKDGVTRYTADVIIDNFMFLQSKRDDGDDRRSSRRDDRSTRSRRDDRDERSSRSRRDNDERRPKERDPLPQETDADNFADDDINF